MALGLQSAMIAVVLILARKHFAKNSAAALSPAEETTPHEVKGCDAHHGPFHLYKSHIILCIEIIPKRWYPCVIRQRQMTYHLRLTP